MTLRAFDFGEADIGSDRIERAHQASAFDRGIQPVTGKGHHAVAHFGAGEHVGEFFAAGFGKIEITGGARQV